MTRFTVPRQERTFTDEYGVVIHYYVWAAPQPKAVLHLVHGLGEHAGRYGHLVDALVEAGFTVFADDHRGHGKTGMQQWNDDSTRLGKLGPGGMPATVKAVHHVSTIARTENRELPLVLLGHSWGSLIAQMLVNRYSYDYDAVVLTGTAYRTPLHMNGGDLNARHKHLGTTGNEWLSRDPKVAAEFADDPLGFSAAALKLFGIIDSLRLLGKPAKNLNPKLPLLVQVGSDDPFGGERSAELLAESYRKRSGLRDVHLIVYTDARHEIFNETNRDEVVADTIGWLNSRLFPE